MAVWPPVLIPAALIPAALQEQWPLVLCLGVLNLLMALLQQQ